MILFVSTSTSRCQPTLLGSCALSVDIVSRAARKFVRPPARSPSMICTLAHFQFAHRQSAAPFRIARIASSRASRKFALASSKLRRAPSISPRADNVSPTRSCKTEALYCDSVSSGRSAESACAIFSARWKCRARLSNRRCAISPRPCFPRSWRDSSRRIASSRRTLDQVLRFGCAPPDSS